MKTLIKTLAVTTALTTATIAPMQAHAAIESLADCYQAVLTWCNETYPDADCSNASGLDDCDEVFGDTSGAMKIDQIMILTYADGTKSLEFHTSPVEEEDDEDDRRDNDRRDNDRDRGNDNGRDDSGRGNDREPSRDDSGREQKTSGDHSASDEHEVEYDVAAGV